MQPGKRRHLVEIQRRSTTQTAEGDQSDTWTTVLRDYASINPVKLRSAERVSADAIQNAGLFTLNMRYSAGITAAMRVKFGSRYFNVLGPPRNLGELGDEMEFEAEEGLNNG